jgi:hemerythrin
MAVIEWNEDLNVGIDSIDEQHRQLIKLINDLHEVIRDQNPSSEVAKVLEALVAYVDFHFADEERLIAAAHYPDLDAHRDLHQWLRGQVMAYVDDYTANPRAVMAAELFEFLSDWLICHIMSEDMRFRPWLEPNGTAARGE